MEKIDGTFQTTIAGLQVRHIATLDKDLLTCDIDDERDVADLEPGWRPVHQRKTGRSSRTSTVEK